MPWYCDLNKQSRKVLRATAHFSSRSVTVLRDAMHHADKLEHVSFLRRGLAFEWLPEHNISRCKVLASAITPTVPLHAVNTLANQFERLDEVHDQNNVPPGSVTTTRRHHARDRQLSSPRLETERDRAASLAKDRQLREEEHIPIVLEDPEADLDDQERRTSEHLKASSPPALRLALLSSPTVPPSNPAHGPFGGVASLSADISVCWLQDASAHAGTARNGIYGASLDLLSIHARHCRVGSWLVKRNDAARWARLPPAME